MVHSNNQIEKIQGVLKHYLSQQQQFIYLQILMYKQLFLIFIYFFKEDINKSGALAP